MRRTSSSEPSSGAERTLRLLYVHPSDELYGSDRVLLGLVSHLDPGRFSPRVLISSDVPYAGDLSRELGKLGVPVSSLRIGVLRRRVLRSPAAFLRFGVDFFLSTLRIAGLLRREGIDIVHANTITVIPAALAAFLTRRPLVWHLHEILPDQPGRLLLLGLLESLADRIVAVSGAVRESLQIEHRTRTVEKITVIPNGIGEGITDEVPYDPPVVAFFGRFSRRKGPDILLRAAQLLSLRHPRVRTLLAGSEFGQGEGLRSELEALASHPGLAGRVTFLPFQRDMAAPFRQATIVVSPSVLPESFGLVILEAMAAGRPVVASDLGGIRELVVPGETGLLVPPGDPAALAQALDQLLSDPALASRLGQAGRRRALSLYGLASAVARFEALYSSIAPGRGRQSEARS